MREKGRENKFFNMRSLFLAISCRYYEVQQRSYTTVSPCFARFARNNDRILKNLFSRIMIVSLKDKYSQVMKTNREEILQSALQLFMSMNYERVSLQMITQSVGLTKTGIFNYYPTKLDLFIAVADRYLFHIQDPENKFAPSDGSLRDFIDKYVEACCARWPKSCVWATSGKKRCPGGQPTPVISTSTSRCSSIILTASANLMHAWKRSICSGVTS